MDIAKPTNPNTDMVRTAGWMGVMPLLAFWPFLSTTPAITLIHAASTPIVYTVQLILLLTGFWGAFLLFIFTRVASKPDALRASVADKNQRIVLIGGYAMVWMVFYTISAFAGR